MFVDVLGMYPWDVSIKLAREEKTYEYDPDKCLGNFLWFFSFISVKKVQIATSLHLS